MGSSMMDARSVKKSRFVIMLMSLLRVNLHFGTNITIFFNNITTIRCFFLRILSIFEYFSSIAHVLCLPFYRVNNCDYLCDNKTKQLDNMEHLMRNTIKVVFTLLLFMVVSGAQMGQSQTIRDKNNSMIARIESDGTVRNSSNSYVARIGSNGDIRDSNNRLLGTVSSDGTLRDNNNSFIGKIENDGTVRNRNNSYMGRVYQDGTVRDRNNSTIGYAKDVPVQYAAIYFFFDLITAR